MNGLQEWLLKVLIDTLGKMLTPEVVKHAEVELVAWLKLQVANTANDIDDKIVEVIANALGVPY